MSVGQGSPHLQGLQKASRFLESWGPQAHPAQIAQAIFRSAVAILVFLVFGDFCCAIQNAPFLQNPQTATPQSNPQQASNATLANVTPPPAIATNPVVNDRVEFELRVVWGGGAARSFNGAIAITDGSIKLVRNLSLQADSIGSITSVKADTLKVAGHSTSTFGGVDIRVTGSSSSRLMVRFDHPVSGKSIENSFELSEVLHQQWARNIDEQGSRLAAERLIQDKIRVQPAQENEIFQAGSAWRGSIVGYKCGLPAGDYQLTTKLLDLGNGEAEIAEQETNVTVDASGNFKSPSLEMPLPTVEGAYSLSFSLSRKRFLPSFVSSSSALQRRLDLVVFDYQAPPTRIQYWAAVATIQPLNSQWWNGMNWLSTLSQTQTLAQLPSFSEHSKRLVSHGDQSTRKVGDFDCLTLGPSAWQAYPLTIEHPDKPHRLRVRIPRDRAQQLIISIRDYHSNSEPSTLNVDSGVVVGERAVATVADGDELWGEHEVVFWPKSQQPYLLMMNGSSSTEASFGELQLEAAQIESFQTNAPAQPLAATTLETSTTSASAQSRAVTLYLSKPLLADAFGAQRSIDPITRRPLESWLTWHQAATRLTHYMMNTGYNTLVLSAISDGGSILPYPRLETTSRFDSGAFFSDGRSVVTKDFVELLSCHFDRCGLKLMLAVDVGNRLPALTRFEDDPKKRAGLLQTNIDGKEWQLDSQEMNRCVLYNPLNDFVQAELEQIVRELSQRYAMHTSFHGIAVELNERSPFAFAGDRWGYDADTLAKFESATESKLPTRDNLTSTMQGGLRLAYLNWRARELSAFYVRLAETVRSAKKDASLLINPLAIWTRPPSQHAYSDPVAASRSLADTLLAAGVDLAWLKQQPSIAVLRGQMQSPLDNDVERDWLSRVSYDSSLQFANAGNSGGSVCLQLPVGVTIPEAKKLASAQQRQHASTAYPIMASIGHDARRVLIERLYYEDSLLLAEGAWMPIQHDSAQMNQFRKALLELPNVPMRVVKVDGDDNNFRMRTVKVGNNTYLQIINNASWTERVTMDVKIAEIPGVYEVLGGRELTINGAATSASASSSSRVDANGKQTSVTWQFDLPPYDMIAMKISDPQFKLNNLMHSSDQSVVDSAKRDIDALESRLAKVSDGARAESLVVPGGDFEVWLDGGRPQGWMTSSLPQTTIGPESSLPHSGSTCVVIENKNQAKVSAWLQSEQIRIPASGRVVVSAWVRSPSVSNHTQIMRLSLIGRMRDGRRYQRSHQFTSNPTTASSNGDVAVDWGRKPVTMHVTDLPSAELTELYVAFDLVGPGKVWLDDVQAFEAYLDPDERVQIQGQLFVAKEKLRQNNAFAAEQLLNSHLARYIQSVLPPPTRQAQSLPKQTAAPEISAEKQVPNERWNKPAPVLKQFRESMRERWQR